MEAGLEVPAGRLRYLWHQPFQGSLGCVTVRARFVSSTGRDLYCSRELPYIFGIPNTTMSVVSIFSRFRTGKIGGLTLLAGIPKGHKICRWRSLMSNPKDAAAKFSMRSLADISGPPDATGGQTGLRCLWNSCSQGRRAKSRPRPPSRGHMGLPGG